MVEPQTRPAGIDGSTLPGPYGVGAYAAKLREFLRERSRVQLFGEVWNLRVSRAKVYLELRDSRGRGAVLDVARRLRCARGSARAHWPTARGSSSRAAWTTTPAAERPRRPSRSRSPRCASPARATCSRSSTGCARPWTPRASSRRRSGCVRPALPRTIGVVTGEGGKARDDVLAGLRRRGWEGRLVWAFAPVQDRHAAPRITAALQDLAATGAVDVIVVARGGGSLADLFCFCDETLCRTIALLGVPVIASVGHHTDRTLIDDVAALSCSTPTHAAESAVPVHCARGARRAARGRAAARRARRAARCWTARRRSRACRARPASTSPASAAGCTSACARSAPPAGAACRPSAPAARRKALVLDRKAHADTLDARGATRLSALASALAAARPRAHARARLRARHRPPRRDRHQRGGRPRAPATCAALRRRRGGCDDPTRRPMTAA